MATRELILKLIGQADIGGLKNAAGQIDDIGTKSGTAGGQVSGLGTKLGGVASIAGGFVVGSALTNLPGLLMDGAKGAAEDEAAMGRLEQAINNTGSAAGDYEGTVQDLISAGQALAFSDGEVADALGTLVSLTGSTEEGMNRLAAAQDLARGANISLEQAAKLLGKTSDENTTALGRLGIALGEGATATDVLAAVQEKFGGQAQQYASSAAGEYEKFNQQMVELQETVGAALIPVFAALAPVIIQVVEAALPLVEALAPLLAIAASALAPVLGLIADGLTQITSTTPGMIALGLAIGVAFAPMLLIPAIIAGVVAVVYVFRDDIIGAFQTVLSWITDNWQTLAVILGGPIGAAVVLIVGHWEEIKATFQNAVDTVTGLLDSAWSTVTGLLQDPVDAGQEAIDAAWGVIQATFDAAWGAISALLSGSWSTVTSLLQIPVDAGKAAIDLAWQAIKGYFDFHVGAVTAVLNSAWAAVQWLLTVPVQLARDGISAALGEVVAFFAALPGQITGAVGDLGTLLFSHGQAIVDGLQTGVASVVQAFLSYVGQIPGRAVSAMGSAGSLLYSWGRDLMQGVVDGILSMAGSIWDAVQSVIPDPGGGVPFVPGIASGGVIRAGGMAIVGERGPELVHLPTGATVFSNQESQRAFAGGGSRGGDITIHNVTVLDGKIVAESVTNHQAADARVQGLFRSTR